MVQFLTLYFAYYSYLSSFISYLINRLQFTLKYAQVKSKPIHHINKKTECKNTVYNSFIK